MLQKISKTISINFITIYWLKIISTFNKKIAFFGDFVKCNFFKRNLILWLKTNKKLNSLIINTKKLNKKIDGTFISFYFNSVLIFKKKNLPIGLNIFYISNYNLKWKKILIFFPKVI